LFTHIPKEAIPDHWERLGSLLAPAVRVDPTITLKGVYDALCAGTSLCFEVTLPNAEGVFVFVIFEDDGRVVCWSSYIAGKVQGGPRQWLRTMREIMSGFEVLIKRAGCVENRIGGRDWSRVFTDYRMHDPATFEMRKEL
jgi:hypothetical protein